MDFHLFSCILGVCFMSLRLTGLALMVYVLARSPGISPGTIRVLEAATSAINALFFLDYLARFEA